MAALRDLKTLLTALCGMFMLAGMFAPGSALPYLSVAFGSYFALRAAWLSLVERRLDVNFLMVLAAAGAVAVGHPLEAAVLLFLFSLSSTLESFAMRRTRSAIEALVKLRPDTAIRVGESGDETVPVSELKVGDRVRVLPFEQIPADGEIVFGSGEVDQAAMTGESQPVLKEPGDKVFAGTQNLDGMLLVSVAASVGDTTLEKIVQLVREAQEHKASGERISHWFGQRYTFFVLVAFLTSLGVRLWLGQPREDALYAALTLLVALSPCALVISTPASTLSALAWAARNGMLIRGGEFIEAAGRVDVVALDKTGTLTRGRFKLEEICVCSPRPAVSRGSPEKHRRSPAPHSRDANEDGIGESVPQGLCLEEDACWRGESDPSPQAKEVLRLAAAAEQYSTHPIAEAIVSAAREWGLDVPEASESSAHAGLGATASVEGAAVRVGQRRFFESEGRTLPPEFVPHVESLHRQGMTVVVLQAEGKFAALGLRDEPRPDAREAILELHRLGVKRVAMLTGDTRETAEAVAREVGIEEVYAGMMPDEKAALVESFARQGATVLTVGDGINDAPVLAVSSVGVAMGGLGSDVALSAADVVLMKDRLSDLPRLVKLGRRTYGIILANLFFSSGVIVALALMTLVFGKIAPGHLSWMLPLAVVGHEGSTVLVILNGLRLLKGA